MAISSRKYLMYKAYYRENFTKTGITSYAGFWVSHVVCSCHSATHNPEQAYHLSGSWGLPPPYMMTVSSSRIEEVCAKDKQIGDTTLMTLDIIA